MRTRLFGEPVPAEEPMGWMGWFAPALSAACLFAAALVPATVPSRVQADTGGTNSAALAALEHSASLSQMNHLAISSFNSTSLPANRSTNALVPDRY